MRLTELWSESQAGDAKRAWSGQEAGSFGDRAEASSDHSLMRRKMVATRMRCCRLKSASRPRGTADGLSGTAVENIGAGSGKYLGAAESPRAAGRSRPDCNGRGDGRLRKQGTLRKPEPVGVKIIWRQGRRTLIDYFRTCRKIVATKMRLTEFWSAS